MNDLIDQGIFSNIMEEELPMKKNFKKITVRYGAIMLLSIISASALLAEGAEVPKDAGVNVEKSNESATGYRVTFRYYNNDVEKVEIKGGFQFYHDRDDHVYCGGMNLEEGEAVEDYYVAPEDWQKGENLVHVGDEGYIADMTYNEEEDVWEYSVDLPGGYYLYVYNLYADKNDAKNVEATSDPANPPICNELGANQTRSQFYVPYEAEKQDEADDWTWCTPADEETARGILEGFTYKGADGTDMNGEIYLPAGYDPDREEPYKVLYLSHGGGDEGDWFYQGHAGNIVDRLTALGECEPFVMVTMNNAVFPSGGWWIEWDDQKYIDNIMNYLLPYVEENYNVSSEASCRAFAGLSSGAVVTGNLLIQETDAFKYYGLFSCSATYAWPKLDDYSTFKNANIYLSGGWADYCLNNKDNYGSDEDVMVESFAEKLDESGLTYNNGNGIEIVPGSHDWFNWPQVLRDYVSTTLWK